MSPFPKWNLQSQIWRSIDYWSAKLSIKSQRKFHFNWAPKRFDIQIRPKSSQMFFKVSIQDDSCASDIFS